MLASTGFLASAPLAADDTARLLSAARDIAAATYDLPRLMEVVRRAARALTGADGVTFVVREGDRVHYADEDAIAPLWKGRRFPMESCISGWAILHDQAVVIEDVFADDRIPHDVYRATFVKSLLMVPVRAHEPVGAIGAYWARGHRASAREVAVVESLASLAAAGLASHALYDDLARALEAREQFLAVAAHELRTPLTALMLQAERARRTLEAERSPALPRVERVQHNAVRLTRQIELLLEASRGVAHLAELDPEELDLAEIAREAALRADDGRGRVSVRATGPVPGRWDRLRLEQILDNLLANALKFGGDAPVEVEVTAAAGEARLAVRDHGIGIAPADQQRIFERFERAVSVRHYGGFGLGLWLVRRNVAAHGGTVTVVSRPGEGAEFTVALPVAAR